MPRLRYNQCVRRLLRSRSRRIGPLLVRVSSPGHGASYTEALIVGGNRFNRRRGRFSAELPASDSLVDRAQR
jgi:hypothetical protein